MPVARDPMLTQTQFARSVVNPMGHAAEMEN